MTVFRRDNGKCEVLFKPKLARLIGLLFLLIGVFFSLKQYIPYHLHCQNKSQGIANQCLLYQPGFRWIFPAKKFNQLYKAKVLRMSSGKTYNLRLYISNQKYTLTGFNINNRQIIKNAVNAINHYIQHSLNNHFVIPKTSSWTSQIIFWFFIPFSLYVLSLTQNRKLVIDKEKQIMQLSHLSLLKKETIIETVALSDIDKFELQSSYGQSGTVYSIIARLKNGNTLDIESVSTNFYHKRQKIINKLNSFLSIGN